MKLKCSTESTINKTTQRLRLILGDQLNLQHSWFQEKDPKTLYLIAELKQEATYVMHHVQKISAFFAAMSDFAQQLAELGHQVLYLNLDETAQYETLEKLLDLIILKNNITHFDYQRPDEYRLEEELLSYRPVDVKTTCYETEHFLLDYSEIPAYFKSEKHIKMEFFYRKMRKRFNILMDAGGPLGGQWNYDTENRASLKQKDLQDIPEPLLFENSVSDILARLKRHNIKTMGKPAEVLIWPINRTQSMKILHYFCDHQLVRFGEFQDAMTAKSEYKWSLYHSRISFALNSKMLAPLEVIHTALRYWEKNTETISLAQIEGFVRQILGWREYIRGIYWVNMPEYADKNFLQANNSLPDFFWSSDTKMRCVQHAVSQSLEYAYAHHIQRLMITGNFCLLTGIDPNEVDAWYLGVYIDAIEWVEMPNTRGMTQFADQGIVATKPYAASGSYINKMSDYCKDCHYKVKHKTEDDACPFNSLYWNFIQQHEDKFKSNPRMRMIYRSWEKMESEKKQAILAKAADVLEHIESL